MLLAYKCDETNQWNWPGSAIFYYNNYSPVWTNNRWDTDVSGVLTNFLELYYKADGSEFTSWPGLNEAAPRDASEWLRNIENIEPRAKADNMFIGFDAFNNPGHSSWSANNWGRQTANAGKKTNFPAAIESGKAALRQSSSTTKPERASGSNSRSSAWPRHTSIWPRHITKKATRSKHSKT